MRNNMKQDKDYLLKYNLPAENHTKGGKVRLYH